MIPQPPKDDVFTHPPLAAAPTQSLKPESATVEPMAAFPPSLNNTYAEITISPPKSAIATAEIVNDTRAGVGKQGANLSALGAGKCASTGANAGAGIGTGAKASPKT